MTWDEWLRSHGLARAAGASAEQIAGAEFRVGSLPPDLRALYSITNGVVAANVEILPLFDRGELKRTWESLERANDVATSDYVDDAEFLKRFLIFADLGGGFAAFDRTDGTIWYSEDDDLHQVDVDLRQFLDLLLKENAS
ncbi:MAG TPA: SMI1/KNR4 family protein [Thermoanaerobaculia bacterium]|nr:SMI1/KNR4 family protein [Thermoanaerobaculia bacterium]